LLSKLEKAAEKGEDARVLFVLSAGHGGTIDMDDLGLKKSYSLKRKADSATTYNDLMVEVLSTTVLILTDIGTRYSSPKAFFQPCLPRIRSHQHCQLPSILPALAVTALCSGQYLMILVRLYSHHWLPVQQTVESTWYTICFDRNIRLATIISPIREMMLRKVSIMGMRMSGRRFGIMLSKSRV